MTLKLILASAFAVATLGAQATIWQLPLWNGRHYEFPVLGPSFVIKDGVLDVLPPPPAPKRVYGECLTYDAATTSWGTIPANATNLAIFFNGLRHSGKEFTIAAGRFTPLAPWKPGGGCLMVDYDLP